MYVIKLKRNTIMLSIQILYDINYFWATKFFKESKPSQQRHRQFENLLRKIDSGPATTPVETSGLICRTTLRLETPVIALSCPSGLCSINNIDDEGTEFFLKNGTRLCDAPTSKILFF